MIDTALVLKALGDENRFRIVEMLLEFDLCVGALAKRLDVSKPAVSQHLKVLREAGLVRGDKRGWFTHYEVDREVLKHVSGELAAMAARPKSICPSGDACEARQESTNGKEKS